MIPTILHRVLLPPLEDVGSIASNWERFRELHPTWTLTTWALPSDINEWEIGRLVDRCTSPAQLADILRIEILLRHGGVYVDADCEPVRPLDPLLEEGCFFGTEDGEIVSTSVIGATPGHPALRAYLSLIIEEDRLALERPLPETTGPLAATAAVGARRDITVFPPEFFYPVPWWADASARDTITDHTYVVHLWAGSWRAEDTRRHQRLAGKVRVGRERIGRVARMATRKVQSWSQPPTARANGVFVGEDTVCVALPDGTPLYARASDLSITPTLIGQGKYDERFRRFLERDLRPGDHVVDVGANIGAFTIQMARLVRRFGRVHAVEADPDVAELLDRNVAMNWLTDTVRVHAGAVGARDGLIRFERANRLRMLSVASDVVTTGQSDVDEFQVPVHRLDALISQRVPLRLVKIDVEGAESEVLDGMTALLDKRVVRLVDLEVIRRDRATWARTARWVRRLCEQYGARPSLLEGDGRRVSVTPDYVLARAGSFAHVVFEFPGAANRC